MEPWLVMLLFGFAILGFVSPGAFLVISFIGLWLWIIGRTILTVVRLVKESLERPPPWNP